MENEILQAVYDKYGYLVISSTTKERLGKIVTNTLQGKLPQPFYIVAETDVIDWLQQKNMANAMGSVTSPSRVPESAVFFYQVKTD